MMTQLVESITVPSGIEETLPGSRRVSVTVPNARALGEAAFTQATLDAYMQIRRKADVPQVRKIVRMWNFIPGIHDRMSADRDRYMAFNAGRYQAMCEWFGGAEDVLRSAPAASGVGWSGDHLVIHAVVSDDASNAVQNPEQTPSVHYSKRFGPMPPSFARATRVDRVLLISGTAAISGENSAHAGDLSRQWSLSLRNLETLIVASGLSADEASLSMLRHVRIYLSEPADADLVALKAREAFAHANTIEILRADLCRRELLVEIEGIAVERDDYV